MRLYSRITVFGALLILLLPAVAFGAQARSSDETLIIARDTVVADDLYAASGTVNIEGTVNGDLLVTGGTVNLDGTVNGDLWVAAGTVNINGTVSDSVRVAGGTVSLNGKVGKDLLAAGGTVTVGRQATIGQDLWTTAGTVSMDGTVGRNLKAGSGTLTIGGIVHGNVNATVDDLNLSAGAQIKGTLTYESPSELSRDTTATTAGTVNYTKAEQETKNYADRVWGQVYWFLAAVLLLLLILLFGRRAAGLAAAAVVSKPWWALLAGLVFTIVTPVVALLLLVTIVGMPLSLMALTGYVIVLYTAKVFVALAVGQALLRKKQDTFWLTFGAGVIGLVLYYVLAAIPFIGPVVTLLTLLAGAGAQLFLFKQLYTDNRKKYGV